MIDVKKLKEGIKLPLLIGVGLLVLMYAIEIGVGLLTQGMDSLMQEIVSVILIVLPFVFFLPFFIWAGYRSVKKYNVYLIEAGLIAAIVAGLIKVIEFVFMLLVMLVIFIVFAVMGGEYLSELPEGTIAMAGLIALSGIFMNAATCAVVLAVTIPVNFLVGILGGYIAGQKKFSEEKKPEKTVEKKPPEKK